ncbi:MAG: response regulator transcription factor [Methanobacteriota archaeon]
MVRTATTSRLTVASGPEPLALRRQTVMVVDDEPDIRMGLKGLLEHELPHVEVQMEPSGEDALDTAKRSEIDLAVVDYKLPGMDGLEFLARLRELDPWTPRILITAFPEVELATRAINEEKVQGFLLKPLTPAIVVQTVRSLLYERRIDALRDESFERAMALLRKRTIGRPGEDGGS